MSPHGRYNDRRAKGLGTDNGSNAKHKLLTIKEAAVILSINPRTLQNWISTKRCSGLKSVKLGGARRFREQDLTEFIESRICTTTVDTNQNPNNKKTHKPSQEGIL
ncbi:MAG: helix-turn-helix domain-containing protein [Puniceicoccales bacterium]|nr:helix-turn-helix domain-containing protein [Puniceicoccales bacterium]